MNFENLHDDELIEEYFGIDLSTAYPDAGLGAWQVAKGMRSEIDRRGLLA